VATGFAMAVTYPRAGNIGGGGFMVIHLQDRQKDVANRLPETAPAATTPEIFWRRRQARYCEIARLRARHRRPATVAGLAVALDKYGSGKFTLVGAVMALAKDGTDITDDLADTLPDWHRRLARWPFIGKDLFPSRRHLAARGHRLVQTDLAADAFGDCEQGPRGFYEGRSPKNW